MDWPARAKTSSLPALHDATLGPALKEPPRSFQSLHCGTVSSGVGGNAGGGSWEAGRDGVGLASYRTIKKRPVPARSSTTLPKIANSDQR
jgi:hypothetical protein